MVVVTTLNGTVLESVSVLNMTYISICYLLVFHGERRVLCDKNML